MMDRVFFLWLIVVLTPMDLSFLSHSSASLILMGIQALHVSLCDLIILHTILTMQSAFLVLVDGPYNF